MSETQFSFLDTSEDAYKIKTKASPKEGVALPYTEEFLTKETSGDAFGMVQDAGMGWQPSAISNNHVLILTTLGGIREETGKALALGFHTGHWELGILATDAAQELSAMRYQPYAVHCSDPCDGRTQGTDGMMDSLPYRNSAAEVMGRLIRSLPQRKGLIGIATCDKGLPAMMMALAEASDLPSVLIPGGSTLPTEGIEDAGTFQSAGTRVAHGEMTVKEAAEMGCSVCGSAGGGCQFLGTAASSQVVGEALGMALPHTALAPSGEPIWRENARNSAKALDHLIRNDIPLKKILTDDAVHNAMVVFAAFGASTNMLLHIPAFAFNAGLKRPTVEDWEAINKIVPRIVDVLPNGPQSFRTVQVYCAGGVIEVMLHLRDMNLLRLDCLTVTGKTLGENLDDWESSERRKRFKAILKDQDGVDDRDVIMSAKEAEAKGLTRSLVFPQGNLTPEGSVVKSTAIAAELFTDGIYRHRGPVRIFTNEPDAIFALRSKGEDRIKENEIIALLCRGPRAAGMPETAQITIALKYTAALKNT
ncbi:MAG: dihydroxy-acid dehydratase, partial [Lentisphaeria bacterium]|nr:dihydroxy-acid dehydratase [Lentisphaeria bacterium]